VCESAVAGVISGCGFSVALISPVSKIEKMDEGLQTFFAVSGFIISASLAVLRAIEFKRDRPNLRLEARMVIQGGGNRPPRAVVLMRATNIGRRVAFVREIGLALENGKGPGPQFPGVMSVGGAMRFDIEDGFSLKESEERQFEKELYPHELDWLGNPATAFLVLSDNKRIETRFRPVAPADLEVHQATTQ
jgi:hypothetical protein